MSKGAKPIAVIAAEAPARAKPSVYPEPFASRMVGREKRQLGDLFGLTNFGVNLTRLAANAVSQSGQRLRRNGKKCSDVETRPSRHGTKPCANGLR